MTYRGMDTSQDYSSSSQPNLLELVKCSCRSIKGCRTRCDFKKPNGHALNFARATVSNELIFASLLLNFTKVTVQNVNYYSFKLQTTIM